MPRQGPISHLDNFIRYEVCLTNWKQAVNKTNNIFSQVPRRLRNKINLSSDCQTGCLRSTNKVTIKYAWNFKGACRSEKNNVFIPHQCSKVHVSEVTLPFVKGVGLFMASRNGLIAFLRKRLRSDLWKTLQSLFAQSSSPKTVCLFLIEASHTRRDP